MEKSTVLKEFEIANEETDPKDGDQNDCHYRFEIKELLFFLVFCFFLGD